MKETLKDLEERIRSLEKSRSQISGGIWVLVVMLGFGAIVIAYLSYLLSEAKEIGKFANSKKIEERITESANKVIPELLNQYKGYTFFLPASRLWMNTGIQVSKNQELEFLISGGVSTALNRHVWHEIDQTKTPYPWKHIPRDPSTETDPISIREEGLLSGSEGGWYRDLLMCVVKDESEFKKLAHKPRSIDSKRISIISPEGDGWLNGKIKLNSPDDGLLCFVINDNYIDSLLYFQSTEENAQKDFEKYIKIDEYFHHLYKNYENPNINKLPQLPMGVNAVDIARFWFRYSGNLPPSPDLLKKWQTKRWGELNHNKYFRLFYDDNIGGYLITVVIKS